MGDAAAGAASLSSEGGSAVLVAVQVAVAVADVHCCASS